MKVTDPDQLKRIKKGDQVYATYTQALAMVVEASPKKSVQTQRWATMLPSGLRGDSGDDAIVPAGGMARSDSIVSRTT